MGSSWPLSGLVAEFVAAAAVSLAASVLMAVRLERVGARLGVSESMLGLLVALAADGPEITSAVTALVRGQRQVGATVVLGSNVFNLAALLGLGAMVAGRVRLHRSAVLRGGAVASWMALVALATVGSGLAPWLGVVLAAAVFVAYVVVSGWHSVLVRLAGTGRAGRWLEGAVAAEEMELFEAIHPPPGGWLDGVLALVATSIVIGASVVMEHAATSVGRRAGLSDAVVGGVVLAVVTSLPNAVAAVHLARHGRGAAVLSEALNSNNLNVLLGLLVPAAILGVGRGAGAVISAAFAAGLTVVVLALAHRHRGLRRAHGAVVLAGYGLFLAVLLGPFGLR